MANLTRRQGFRPRPLDPYKSITIVRSAEGVEFEDDALLPVKFGEGTLTYQLQLEAQKGKGTQQKKINIPAPPSESSKTFDTEVKPSFRPPSAFIRYRTEAHETGGEDEEEIEYELTLQDEKWLKTAKAKLEAKQLGMPSQFQLDEDNLEKMIDLLEKYTARNAPITLVQAADLFAARFGLYPGVGEVRVNRTTEEVYNYWIQKRQKMKKPLLRRFWPITATNDSSPHLTFRPREKERYKLRKKRGNDKESYEKLAQLKRDFLVVRSMLELVRRREKLREMEAIVLEDGFEQQVWELVHNPEDVRRGRIVPKRPRLFQREQQLEGVLDIDPDELFESFTPTAKAQDYPEEVDYDLAASTSVPSAPDSDMAALNDPSSTGPNNADPTGARKRKKKRKKKEEDEPWGPSGSTEAADSLTSLKQKKKKKKSANADEDDAAADVDGVVDHRRIKKSEFHPSFLLPLEHLPQYVFDDLEVTLPIVPTYPPQSLQSRLFAAGRMKALRSNHYFHHRNRPPIYQQRSVAPCHDTNRSFHYSNGAASLMQDIIEDLDQENQRKQERPHFRCRGRIGRGGRILIDRIPVNSLTTLQLKRKPQDIYAFPHPLDLGQDFLDPSLQRTDAGLSPTWQTDTPSLTLQQQNKLQNIYRQDDSEDEEVLVLDHPLLAPVRFPDEEKARVQAAGGGICRTKVPKFRFQL